MELLPSYMSGGGYSTYLAPRTITNGCKVVSGTTKCQKDIVSENKTCLDNINLHNVLLAM